MAACNGSRRGARSIGGTVVEGVRRGSGQWTDARHKFMRERTLVLDADRRDRLFAPIATGPPAGHRLDGARIESARPSLNGHEERLFQSFQAVAPIDWNDAAPDMPIQFEMVRAAAGQPIPNHP